MDKVRKTRRERGTESEQQEDKKKSSKRNLGQVYKNISWVKDTHR